MLFFQRSEIQRTQELCTNVTTYNFEKINHVRFAKSLSITSYERGTCFTKVSFSLKQLTRLYSDFNVKLLRKKILVIFSHVDICFEKTNLRNEPWCKKERVVSRSATRPGNSFRTIISLCLKIQYGLCLPPRGQMYRITFMLCRPLISVLLQVSACTV
jgi:hypothetical protein